MDIRSLLPVQSTDSRIAQLEHRKAQLPEHAAAATAQKALAAVQAEVERLEKRRGEIAVEIERLEKRGKELDAKKAKYEHQLKSVVVMREVEALQHEIATINAEHSSLDDAELALLDENETLDKSLADARGALPQRESDATDAAARLTAALAAVDADLAAARDERTRLAGSSDAESLALYEQIRKRMSSAAVAELAKGSCAGCHTSISPKEQAEIKKVADTSEARCPYCGCLLVV